MDRDKPSADASFTKNPTRRQLTIVFVDVVGSTSLMAKIGDLAMLTVIAAYFGRADGLVLAHEGRTIKHIGDSLMAVFGSAEKAVDFALEFQRSLSKEPIRVIGDRLRARIGLHVGDVLVESASYGDDVFGTAVDMAARISSLAGPDEIVVSQPTGAILSNEKRGLLGTSEYVEVKGFDGTVEINRINLTGAE